MTKEKLEQALELLLSNRHDWSDFSDVAHTAVESLLEEWVEDFDYYGPLLEEDLGDCVNHLLDNVLMYYRDAFEYLEKQNIWNIEDAVREGFGNTIGSLADYYLQNEVYSILYKLGIY